MTSHRAPVQFQQLWAGVGRNEVQAAATLAAARATPPGPAEVEALLQLASSEPPSAALLPVLSLLTRWARQQSLQPAAGRLTALLLTVATSAQQLLTNAAANAAPQLAAACLLLLGSAAPALKEDQRAVEAIVGAVGGALLNGSSLGGPNQAAAADALAAVGNLLPCLLGKPVAACWLLSALLRWLGTLEELDGSSCLAVDFLAPAYGMMRGVGTAAINASQPGPAVAGLLQPSFAVLKTAIAASQQQASSLLVAVPAACAVLAVGGLCDALQRGAAGYSEASQLAAEAEAALLEACTAAAATEIAPQPAAAALFRNACSLAATQLTAAAQSPRLLVAAAVARCQTWSLLHSALSLDPLHRAAAVQLPPAAASAALQRQLGCALMQHAGSLASSLAARYAALDGGTQRWLLEQVQAAARQAHQHYRHYSLSSPLAWLSAVDADAVRQILDRLFLSCLVLLAAALEAVGRLQPAPSVAAATLQLQPAQLSALAARVLADLQFCRLSSPPQYAAVLKAALADLPGDAQAASSLASCLPCYAELAAPCATRGGEATWLVDGAGAAKVQFVMSLLVPCCNALSLGVLENQLAPLAFLYLLHPHPPTAAAAHNLLCSLLVAVPQPQRPPLAAYYVQRCLEGCPGTTSATQLAQGLATVMEVLPVGCPVALLCLHQVLATCCKLSARGDPSAQELAAVAAQQLLIIDHLLLDEAMAAFDRVLHPLDAAAPPDGGVPSAAAAAVLQREVVAAVRRTDDCLRKPVLAAWLLRAGG